MKSNDEIDGNIITILDEYDLKVYVSIPYAIKKLRFSPAGLQETVILVISFSIASITAGFLAEIGKDLWIKAKKIVNDFLCEEKSFLVIDLYVNYQDRIIRFVFIEKEIDDEYFIYIFSQIPKTLAKLDNGRSDELFLFYEGNIQQYFGYLYYFTTLNLVKYWIESKR